MALYVPGIGLSFSAALSQCLGIFGCVLRLSTQHLLKAKTLGFVIDSNIDDDAPFGVLVRLLRNDQYGIAPD